MSKSFITQKINPSMQSIGLEIIAKKENNKVFQQENTLENDYAEAQEIFGEFFEHYKEKVVEASKIMNYINTFFLAKGTKTYFTQHARNKICFVYAQKNEEERIPFLQEIYSPIREKNEEQYRSILIK